MNPDEDPMLRLQYYKETGQNDEAQKYEQYLRETNQYKQSAGTINKLGLAQRQVAMPQQEDGETDPGYFARLATHVLNTAQGISGMEAFEAGAGALGSHLPGNTPMSYEQSLQTLRDATGQIGGKTAAAEKMMGSVATLPFLGANPALAGAQLGGADQLLSADPNESLAMRAAKTAGGAAVGGLLGKGADMAVTAGRSLLSVNPANAFLNQSYAANLLSRQAAKAEAAKALFDRALAEGQGKTATAQIKTYMAEPDVAEIVNGLRETRQFRDLPAELQPGAPETPELLDAIFKTFSDKAKAAKKGLDAFNPSKANLGRFNAKNISQAQQDMLDAISGGSTVPGPMPTYRTAVTEYAKHASAEDALKRGYDATAAKLSEGIPSSRTMMKTGPEVFGKWAAGATPEQASAAAEGALAASRAGLLSKPLTTGRRALGAASSTLRKIPGDQGANVAKGGLLGLRNSAPFIQSLLGW
jgi:hypothetical protein